MSIPRTSLTAWLLGFVLLFPITTQSASLWKIPGEEKARFDAKIVDVLCEITGDCPKACGAGTRQLGLLTPEGKLILAVKSRIFFAGAVKDLSPFCGETITVDGLMIKDDDLTMFVLQNLRPKDGGWRKADRVGTEFAEENPDKKPNQWFFHHPMIKEHLDRYGILGVPGLEPAQ